MGARSVRLDTEMERELDRFCRETGESASEVIRKSLAAYMAGQGKAPSLYDLGHDLFGADKTQRVGNVSGSYRRLIRERMGAKHHR